MENQLPSLQIIKHGKVSPLIPTHQEESLDGSWRFKMQRSLSRCYISNINICVDPSHRRKIFDELHSGNFGGHFSFSKTLDKIKSRFSWPNMSSDIKKWLKECIECAWKTIGIDYFFPKNPCKDFKYIIMIVDYFSNFLITAPVPNLATWNTKDNHFRCWLTVH